MTTHSAPGTARVRLASSQDLERIGRFRYHVYIRELGRQALFADHRSETLIEPADLEPRSSIFYTESEGRVTGTVRVTLGPFDETQLDPYSAVTGAPALRSLPAAGMVLVTRLMVAPTARGLGDVTALVQQCFEHSCHNGVVIGLASCKPALQTFFQRAGFAVCGPDYLHPDAGVQRPMLTVVEPAFLTARRSRFATLCEQHQPHSPWSRTVEGIFHERLAPLSPAPEHGAHAPLHTHAPHQEPACQPA